MATKTRKEIMKDIALSYLRSLLATTLTAVFAIGKLPTSFDSGDWTIVANTVWISFVPVIIRLLNPKDTLGNAPKSE
jgi:hypothetical protein